MQRILVAEDDDNVRIYLYDELTAAGYTVTGVGNGAEAIVTAAEESFDLIVLDMLMPGLDGVQTIRVLRKIRPNLPIIGLTGYVGLGYMAQAACHGVICLPKPVNISDLLKEIRAVIPPDTQQEG